MSTVNFVNSHRFLATQNKNSNLICYVFGFGTDLRTYEKSLRKLRSQGYDVLAFATDPKVFNAGDPQILLDIIDDVTHQVNKVAGEYESVICMGVSLGAFISFNVQRRVANAFFGAYATAGVSVAETIFRRRAFRKAAKVFQRNGYSQESLAAAWKDIDIDPNDPKPFDPHKSFTVLNGTGDRIVLFRDSKRYMAEWNTRGARVKVLTMPLLGHMLTCMWYLACPTKMIKKSRTHHLKTKA